MVTATSARMPNYFLVAFGGPHATAHPVDGGSYPLPKSYISNSGISPGDVLLLYCTGTYPGHYMDVPGIGVVTRVETGGVQENIYYQYFPLCHPIFWGDVSNMIATIPELKDNTNFGLTGNQLRAIGNQSFRAAIAGRQVDWP